MECGGEVAKSEVSESESLFLLFLSVLRLRGVAVDGVDGESVGEDFSVANVGSPSDL